MLTFTRSIPTIRTEGSDHPEGVTTRTRLAASIAWCERHHRRRHRAACGTDRRGGGRHDAEQAVRRPARDRRDRRGNRLAGDVVLPRADLPDPARTLDASAARAGLQQRPAAVVGASRARAGRPVRSAGDHPAARRRWPPAGQGPGRRRQASEPDRPARGGPRGACRDQLGARYRSRGPVDRDRRGRGVAVHQIGAEADATAGARPRCRRRQLRGAVVHLRLAADRGRDPDRGDRDRRAAAAPATPSRAPRRGYRHARLDRDGVVHGSEQQRLRARSSRPPPLRSPDRRSVRVDDRDGDRDRGRDQSDHGRRTEHVRRRGSAPAAFPAGGRPDHRGPGNRLSRRDGQERRTRSCSQARTHFPGSSRRPEHGRSARSCC